MIVPAESTLKDYDLALPLPLYAQRIQVTECSFWGVNNPDDEETGCRKIWVLWQRDMVSKYLAEAQEEIEQNVHFPLAPTYFANEQQSYSCPIQAKWGRVIEAGIEATTTIQAGVVVNHAADPAVVSVVTTVTDEDEIFVFHPGSDVKIIPSAISIAGGTATISIPRCRMVTTAKADNPGEGWAYSDLANFEATVDVKRIYTDPSTNATLVFPHQCTGLCATNGCSEKTKTACMYIRIPEIGSLDVAPASYNGGWSTSGAGVCYGDPQFVRLNYRAGMTPLTYQAEDAILRLAHSKMPNEVCACEVWSRLWERDRHIPEILTRERLNCPYGQNDGAWISWQFSQALKLVRGFTL